MRIIKTCKYHGDTEYRRDSKTREHWRCCKCSSEAVQKRRDKLKLLAIEYKGSKCCRCGYNKCPAALEFHRLDPSQKEFGVAGKGLTRSFEKLQIELDKCVLLCANCHREIHWDLDNSI